MNKRGISPLIAWVLLVGIAVAVGLVVTQWAIKEFQDLDFPEDKETYCNDVDIKLEEICIQFSPDNINDSIRLNITNEGFFSVRRLTIGRQTTAFSEEWCTMLNVLIDPNLNQTIEFKAGSKNLDYKNIEETSCQTSLTGGFTFNESHKLLKIEIVPWIEINDETFHCIGKGILLNNSLEINNYCTN